MNRKEEYQRYLASPEWKKKRADVIKVADHRCEWHYVMGERCKTNYLLDVHHLNYDHLWHETIKDVVVLCKKHHMIVHMIEWKCKQCNGPLFHLTTMIEEWVDSVDIDFSRCKSISEIDRFRPSLCVFCSEKVARFPS
jgi:hypothetical protein